jgi:hypothetical protein
LVSFAAGAPYSLKIEDFGFSDPDDSPSDHFSGVKIVALPSVGVLLLDGVAIAADQLIVASDIAAGKLKYVPPATANGRDGFTFQVQDDGGTENNGVDLDPAPKSLAFNLSPVAVDDVYEIRENTTLDLRTSDLQLSLIHSTSADSVSNNYTHENAEISVFKTLDSFSILSIVCKSGNDTWHLNFANSAGGQLTTGTYANAFNFMTGSHPYLSIYRNVPIPEGSTGLFTINSILCDSSGEVLQLDLTFQQYNSSSESVSGHLQFSVANPSDPVGVLSNDHDDGDPLTAMLVTAPEHGTVYFHANGGFVYAPENDYAGPDSFQYKINDGLMDSDVATVSLNVTRASQAPTGADFTVTVTPDSTYIVKAEDFGFADIHDSPPDVFTRVKIVSLPSEGELLWNGQAVEAGQFVTVADIAEGKLTFTVPAMDLDPSVGEWAQWTTAMPTTALRSSRLSFDFQVQDSGSLDNGGMILDPLPKTFAFNIASVAQCDSYTVPKNRILDESLDVTRLKMTSQSGDYIGNGLAYDFNETTGQFSAGGDRRSIWIEYESGSTRWYLNFYAPVGSVLSPGTYTVPAGEYYTSDPHLNISNDSRYTYYTSGQFTVNQIVFNALGEVEQCDLSFVQYAGSSESLSGRIQVHSSATGARGLLKNDIDADGDQLSAILVAGPSHGTLSLDSRGGFRYAPDVDFTGIDSFQYKSNDGAADGNTQMVWLYVGQNASIYINNVTQSSGTIGTPIYTFTVGISGPSDEEASVSFATQDGTATDGSDYTGVTGMLHWDAGSVEEKTISVAVLPSLFIEPTETFYVHLFNEQNVRIAISEGVGTILGSVSQLNIRPSASIATPSTPQAGDVTINYTLIDHESDKCDILVEYSYDGLEWITAQSAGGDGITGLAASPDGVNHTFIWANPTIWPCPVVGGEPVTSRTVMFRITPSDEGGAGLPAIPESLTILVPSTAILINPFVGDRVSDFNGDGTSDILWYNRSNGEVKTWIVRDGVCNSWAVLGAADPAAWSTLGYGDFNGDGTTDVLWKNNLSGLVGTWLIRNGAYQDWSVFGTVDFLTWKVIGIDDFNGDGTADILWRNQTTNEIGLWIDRNGTYGSWTSFGAVDPTVWANVGIGDFNGDGTADILWRNMNTGLVGAWLLRNGGYGDWSVFGTVDFSGWRVSGVGDFNGDGTSDIFWHNQTTGEAGAWIVRNGAYGSWAYSGVVNSTEWESVGIRDLDGDKTADIVWKNLSSGLVGAWIVRDGIYNGWSPFGVVNFSDWRLAGRYETVLPLHAENMPATPVAGIRPLVQNDIQLLVDAAIDDWAAAGLNASALAKFQKTTFVIADLPGTELGEAVGDRIYLDATAAGHGWFVDSTPKLDEEFLRGSDTRLHAIDAKAVDRIDLLSVLEHELGHLAGFDDLDALAENVMDQILGDSLRRRRQ